MPIIGTPYNGQLGPLLPGIPVPRTIQSSTGTTPIVVQSIGHGLSTGDYVQINGHTVNTQADGRWEVQKVDADHVILLGSSSSVSGGATGTIVSLGFGTPYNVPADGDDNAAGTYLPSAEGTGDRAALLAADMPGRRLSQLVTNPTDNGASENTAWTETHVMAAQNTWEQVLGPGSSILTIATLDNILQFDTVDISLDASFLWTDSGGTGDGVTLSIFSQYFPWGGSLPTPTRISGSAKQVGDVATGVTAGRSGIHLRGVELISHANVQRARFYLYAFTRDATPGNVSILGKGSWRTDVRAYRNTAFAGRLTT